MEKPLFSWKTSTTRVRNALPPVTADFVETRYRRASEKGLIRVSDSMYKPCEDNYCWYSNCDDVLRRHQIGQPPAA